MSSESKTINLQNQPWLQYKRPFVRDLAFAIACPDVLNSWRSPNSNVVSPKIEVHKSGFWLKQYENYAVRLQELDNSTAYQDLTRYLMSRPSPYRLGFHFEGLIHFWLEDGYALNLHPYEVVAHNVQLYNGSQTTGELDFILRNHVTNHIEHWELAIKFYLGSKPYDFANWVGINSRDTLERKLIHMQSKPFRSVWVDLDFYEKVKIDKRYAVIKGRFFLPNNDFFSHQDYSINIPEWLNQDFPIHKWYGIDNRDDFEELNAPNLRHTHYVEWFTHRPFYDADFLINGSNLDLNPILSEEKPTENKAELSRRKARLNVWPYKPLKFENITTNLYMNNGEPLVIKVG